MVTPFCEPMLRVHHPQEYINYSPCVIFKYSMKLVYDLPPGLTKNHNIEKIPDDLK